MLRLLGHHALRFLPGALVSIVALHFAVTLAYLTPPNPVRLRLSPLIQAYMSPYFDQRWELFAPDPVADARLLQVSCRSLGADGDPRESAWSAMTAPLRELRQRYRLTPADRLDRAQQAAIHMMFEKQDALVEKLVQREDEHRSEIEPLLAGALEARRERADLGRRLLTRAASAECDRTGDAPTVAVRVRLVVVKTPPFSQRAGDDHAGRPEYVDLGWAPYEPVERL
jgi:hypothetical protein